MALKGNMENNNVTSPIDGIFKTSYIKILGLCVVVGPFLVLALLWLSSKILPAELAESFQKPLLALWGVIGTGAVVGWIGGAWKRLGGQIETQKEIAISQAETQIRATAAREAASYIKGDLEQANRDAASEYARSERL
jgi:hypothetical protein